MSEKVNISLCRNCEVAFALHAHGISVESSLLNWAYILDDISLFKAVENPLNAFSEGGEWVNGFNFKCRSLDVLFHGRRNPETANGGDPGTTEIQAALAELKSRTNYLARKFSSQLSCEDVNAFLKPPREFQESGEIRDFSLRLRKLIDTKYPSNNVHIFVVTEGGDYRIEPIEGSACLFMASISSYTHDSTSNQFTDQAMREWKNIFDFACCV